MELHEVVKYIKKADTMTINDLTMAVINRYRELFPDEEICFFSLPRDEKNREVELERITGMYKKYGSQRNR